MSGVFNDKNLDWYDSYENYCNKHKSKPHLLNKKKDKSNWENASIEYDDEYDDRLIGLSKESGKCQSEDDLLKDEQGKLNKGKRRRNRNRMNWRDSISSAHLRELMGLDDDIY